MRTGTLPLQRSPSRLRARENGLWARREALVLMLVPALISFLMLWPALLGRGVFAPTDIVAREPLFINRPPGYVMPPAENPLLTDVVDTFIPWRLYARGELMAGRFPLWNSYNLLGTHFHANLQSQLLSPFTLLWLVLPPVWGLGVVAFVEWTLAGLGMGLLLRRLGLSLPAAILGSTAFQLSGPLVGWLQWPIAVGLLWVPWMMWAALGWIDTLRPKWLLALSALVAAEMLAGHIETSFHSAVFLGAFALAAWLAAPHGGRQRLLSLGGLLLAGLLGAAISAAQIVPFLDVLPRSYQWWLRSQVDTSTIYMDPSAALMWLSANGFGWPDAYAGPRNWIEANPYVGALTLLLGVWFLGVWILGFGSVRWRRAGLWVGIGRSLSPRRPLFWALILAASLSMSYGIPPLNLLNKLPGFSTSVNWRLVSVAGPCLIVLAAMGLNRLLTLFPRPFSVGWAAVAAGFSLASAGFLVVGWRVSVVDSQQTVEYTQAWRAWAGVLFCVGAVLILARLLGWLRPQAFALLTVGLLALDMVRAMWGFNPTVPHETFYPPNVLLQFAAERGPTERLAVAGRIAESNILTAYRVPGYSLYDATLDNRFMTFTRLMSPETFREAFRRQDAGLTTHLVLIKPSAALLSAAGIKWLLTDGEDPNTWEAMPEQGPIYKRTLTKNFFTIWENLYARSFTYFATNYHLNTGRGEVADRALQTRMQTLAPATVNVTQIEDPDGSFPPEVGRAGREETPPRGESVALESYAPGDVRVRAVAERPRFLVLSESWSPDWRATVDGQPARIYRTNYVLQGVVVPEGEHTVRFVYDPPAFRWGVGISVAATLAWLVLVAWFAWITRPKRAAGTRIEADGVA